MIIAIGCAAGRIMSTLGLPFAAINTDWRALEQCTAEQKITDRRVRAWCGSQPGDWRAGGRRGRRGDRHTLYGTGAPGGGPWRGTGTGAAPVVARIARAQGCEVTAVVTWPLPSFEGRRRAQQARRGLTALQAYVPRIAMVKLRELLPLPPATRIRDVFEMADHKAASAVMDTLRGYGRMASNASGGSLGPITSLFGGCAPSFIDPPVGPVEGLRGGASEVLCARPTRAKRLLFSTAVEGCPGTWGQ